MSISCVLCRCGENSLSITCYHWNFHDIHVLCLVEIWWEIMSEPLLIDWISLGINLSVCVSSSSVCKSETLCYHLLFSLGINIYVHVVTSSVYGVEYTLLCGLFQSLNWAYGLVFPVHYTILFIRITLLYVSLHQEKLWNTDCMCV
jgi:hypothetical protein